MFKICLKTNVIYIYANYCKNFKKPNDCNLIIIPENLNIKSQEIIHYSILYNFHFFVINIFINTKYILMNVIIKKGKFIYLFEIKS